MSDSTWRLIPLLHAAGQVQMALDSWLLEQHRAGQMPSILRFYTWLPIALSLGYHQRRVPPAWQHLVWQNQPVDLVPRPSGGRAVLHQGDLTYAVITSNVAGTRMQAYQTICEFLIQGWRSLDVELHYGTAGRGYIHNPNCFGTATAADLVTVQGRKLIGSAQLRRGQAILQHGSIRLAPDPELFRLVFAEEPEPPPLDPPPAIDAIIEALTAAAGRSFGLQFINQPLSEAEWQQAIGWGMPNLVSGAGEARTTDKTD